MAHYCLQTIHHFFHTTYKLLPFSRFPTIGWNTLSSSPDALVAFSTRIHVEEVIWEPPELPAVLPPIYRTKGQEGKVVKETQSNSLTAYISWGKWEQAPLYLALKGITALNQAVGLMSCNCGNISAAWELPSYRFSSFSSHSWLWLVFASFFHPFSSPFFQGRKCDCWQQFNLADFSACPG